MTPMQQATKEFLDQRRIAVAGVSRDAEGAADLIARKLRETGHDVFMLHPTAAEVRGQPCWPGPSAVPGGVDAVVAVTPPSATEAIVRACVDAGVRHVWMHRSLGDSVSAVAVDEGRRHGLTVIAGGCPMMFLEPVDFGHRCLRWWCGATGRMPR